MLYSFTTTGFSSHQQQALNLNFQKRSPGTSLHRGYFRELDLQTILKSGKRNNGPFNSNFPFKGEKQNFLTNVLFFKPDPQSVALFQKMDENL